jgi:hypothetical protein
MAPRYRLFGRFLAFFLLGTLVLSLAPSSPAQPATPAPASPAPSVGTSNPEFLATADEVVKEMSQITGWSIKTPLKKSIRSREDIHAYILHQMDDEKDAKERYASARSAEAFGLIPKDFNLDTFLVDLLTEQIAGLYDPKAHEFYIADWIPADEQRMVMAHELTHALEDQHFDIEPWVHAARPNDDAEMARESVLEGSAMAAMLEYELKGKGLKLKDLPEFDPSVFVGDLAETPILKKAPPFIKDSLMFPYFSGLTFSMGVLKSGGWPAFSSVFARPPANTQQILHPEMYFANRAPLPLKVELPAVVPGENWVNHAPRPWPRNGMATSTRRSNKEIPSALCCLPAFGWPILFPPRAFSRSIPRRWRRNIRTARISRAAPIFFRLIPAMATYFSAAAAGNASLWKAAVPGCSCSGPRSSTGGWCPSRLNRRLPPKSRRRTPMHWR